MLFARVTGSRTFCAALFAVASLFASVRVVKADSFDIKDYGDCFFALADKNGVRAEFNLSDFHLTDKAIQVDDKDNDWDYFFNLCGVIPRSYYLGHEEIFSACYTAQGPCLQMKEDGSDCEVYYDTTDQIPLAVQVNEERTRCYWMGAEMAYAAEAYKVKLLDKKDGAKGMIFEYVTGTYCQSMKKNRTLHVELLCPDTPRWTYSVEDESTITEDVFEDPTCTYTLTYESALACPVQCIQERYNLGSESDGLFEVCHGAGLCASDPEALEVRCICDGGLKGDNCDKKLSHKRKVKENHTAMTTAIILCIVMLAIVVVLSAFLCHRIRLKEMEQQGNLGGEFFSPMLDDEDDVTGPVSLDDGVSMHQMGPMAAAATGAPLSSSSARAEEEELDKGDSPQDDEYEDEAPPGQEEEEEDDDRPVESVGTSSGDAGQED